MGKTSLDVDYTLPSNGFTRPPPSKASIIAKHAILGFAVLAGLTFFSQCYELGPRVFGHGRTSASYAAPCAQVAPLVPQANAALWEATSAAIASADFKKRAVSWLGGAVQIPTETFDGMGEVGEDPRFEIHAKFHEYLLGAFPLVHKTFEWEAVNSWALLYTLKGTDDSLKPLLLLAHSDVVPVNPDTADQWSHPAFSGHFDGERIWGRGSSDDKSGLVGILSAAELLLEKGFKPARTVIFAFGYDEEGGGYRGAGSLSAKIIDMYGKDSIAMVVDEGGGYMEQFGSAFATPGIAEKGSTNVHVQVDTPGGHSSIPPAHTGIGILSRLLVEFEEKPFEVHLERGTTAYELFQCFAEYAVDLPADLRHEIKKSVTSDDALRNVEDVMFEDVTFKSLAGTTTAIDMIHGGVKSNALPEQAWAVINHRVSTQSTVEETRQHDSELLVTLASKYNLTYNAFGEDMTAMNVPSKGKLSLVSPGGLNPAPVTPFVGDEATAYKLLSGTIKSTYNVHRELEGDNIAVAPGMPSGNTDTRFYWDLTPHIFRYNHHGSGKGSNPLGGGVHSVNESMSADSFLEIILFFSTLILNVDETTVL